MQDAVFIKPEPVSMATRIASVLRNEALTRSARGSRSALDESPFASTKEMLEQMHWSDISILKRLAETSVAFGTQVKELTSREDRVARVDELVANVMRVLHFVKNMGTKVYFGKDLNHMLMEIEQAAEIATDVLEECEHGDQGRKEQVRELTIQVLSLDLHFSCMRTVLTRYEFLGLRIYASLGTFHSNRQCVFVCVLQGVSTIAGTAPKERETGGRRTAYSSVDRSLGCVRACVEHASHRTSR